MFAAFAFEAFPSTLYSSIMTLSLSFLLSLSSLSVRLSVALFLDFLGVVPLQTAMEHPASFQTIFSFRDNGWKWWVTYWGVYVVVCRIHVLFITLCMYTQQG